MVFTLFLNLSNIFVCILPKFEIVPVSFQSHSSVLTDDEAATAHSNKSGIAKLRAVYAQNKVEELQL